MGAAQLISTERMAEMWREYPDELTALLELQAEKAAARAVQLVKKEVNTSDWITKEEAMELLEASYNTLNNLANEGKVTRNKQDKRGRKWYSRKSIEAYKAGKV